MFSLFSPIRWQSWKSNTKIQPIGYLASSSTEPGGILEPSALSLSGTQGSMDGMTFHPTLVYVRRTVLPPGAMRTDDPLRSRNPDPGTDGSRTKCPLADTLRRSNSESVPEPNPTHQVPGGSYGRTSACHTDVDIVGAMLNGIINPQPIIPIPPQVYSHPSSIIPDSNSSLQAINRFDTPKRQKNQKPLSILRHGRLTSAPCYAKDKGRNDKRQTYEDMQKQISKGSNNDWNINKNKDIILISKGLRR
ncbi:hypothetical protein ACRALDRAFT_211301 [Sodiomyces alcalophilus JCM 7366]|uniref:uncharacterized protein n=1 Tax=Sodiomyces alcalophilus JCM 7366 TaxID=591952 RepID=UPI0039B5CE1F